MPFVFRDANSSDNPTLAQCYGFQSTEGLQVYNRLKNGRLQSIVIIGNGEMDGVSKIFYHGEEVPEFINGDRIWRVHRGTITRKPNYKKTTSLDSVTNRLTFSLGHGFTFPQPATPQKAVVVGRDLPSGMEAKEYYVKAISSSVLELYNDQALTDIVNFTVKETTQISLYNPEGVGFNDPEQGRPEFFPELNYTFSGIAYVEFNFTPEQTAFDEDGTPTELKILVRGKRLQNYTSTGLLADANGVAFPDQNNLPAQTKFFSDNNALVAVDIMLNSMKMKHSRIDWESFVVFRDRCDGIIEWDSGEQNVAGVPTWQFLQNLTNSPLDNVYKHIGGSAWNAGGTTRQTAEGGTISIEATFRKGKLAFGLSKATVPITPHEMLYDIELDEHSVTGNKVMIWEVLESGTTYNMLYTDNNLSEGQVFKIILDTEVEVPNIKFYRNETLLFTKENPNLQVLNLNPIRGGICAHSQDAKLSGIKFFPLNGTQRDAERYNFDVVFPNETPANVALEQVFSRAPGCHWQDVNGKVTFIAYPNAVPVNQYTAGKRVIIKELLYDPRITTIKSNIVQRSFSAFVKPTEEKINIMRIEYRDFDDRFYKKQYSILDRPRLRDEAEMIVDSGIVSIGVATKSLADRMGETGLRFGSDLDLFVQLKGLPRCYQIAKGDVVYLAHDVTEWDIYNSKLFLVIEETFDSTIDGAGEKSFLLQIYRPDFYDDTAHGQIYGIEPTTDTFVYPPKILDLGLTEIIEQNGNITSYKINGQIFFDTSYNKVQRARVYYRHETSIEESVISIEQPNAGTESADFTINPVIAGTYHIRVVTENLQGKASDKTYTTLFTVEPSLYPRRELLQHIFTGMKMDDDQLVKTAPDGWENNQAIATRRISNNETESYLEFTLGNEGGYITGLNYEGVTTFDSLDVGIEVQRVSDGKLIRVRNNSSVVNSITWEEGDLLRLVVTSDIKVYLYRGIEQILLATIANSKFPLTNYTRIYYQNYVVPKLYMYGNMEDTIGRKLHSISSRGVLLDANDDYYKVTPTGWNFPNNAHTFSLEYLDSDGAVEFIASETDTYRMVGLAYDDFIPTTEGENCLGKVDYTIYLSADLSGTDHLYYIREKATGNAVNLYVGFYSTGDIFRIVRKNNLIFYLKNGIIVYSSLIPVDTTKDLLHVRTDFYNQNATIKNLRLFRVGQPMSSTYFGSALIHQIEDIEIFSRPSTDGDVFFQLAMTFDDQDMEYTNINSVSKAKIKVRDKFGNTVKEFPPFTFLGEGIVGQGYHGRKYADPIEEAIYEIRIATNNTDVYSAPIYFNNGVISLTEPFIQNINNSPKDLTVVPVDHSRFLATWNFADTVNVELKSLDGTWVVVGEEIATTSFTITDLSPLTEYDVRVVSNSNAGYFSNIVRGKTLQQPLPTESYPAPTNLSSVPVVSSQVDLTWVRNASNNDAVEVYVNDVLHSTLGATITSISITNLTANTLYSFKVRNKWNPSNFSGFAVKEQRTNPATSTQAPYGLNATAVSANAIALNWSNAGGTGNIIIERSVDSVNWNSLPDIVLSPNSSSYVDTGMTPLTTRFYRVRNNAVAGYTNIASDTTHEVVDW